MYRERGFEWCTPPGLDLAACCDAWAALPLLFQPGAGVELLRRHRRPRAPRRGDLRPVARPLLRRADLRPAGDDRHRLPRRAEHQLHRLAALYAPDPGTGRAAPLRRARRARRSSPPDALSGGGGLVSTAADYHRFTPMLLNRGELDGVRLLGPRTVRLHGHATTCPAAPTSRPVGRPLFAETTFDGVGFGLGFAVVAGPGRQPRRRARRASSRWGGAASTAFWVDPVERAHGAVPHAAAAVEHLSDPPAAAPARPPGARGLSRAGTR